VNAHKRRSVIWAYRMEDGRYCDAYTSVRFAGYRGRRTTASGWYDGDCGRISDSEAAGDAGGASGGSGGGEWKWIWNGPLTRWPTIIQ
jgi:hypothetical protein